MAAEGVIAEIASEEARSHLPRWDERPRRFVRHIVDFYHLRLRAELPELVSLAAKVESRHAEKAVSCPRGLRAHLTEVHDAVPAHLAKEEQILFPMIVRGHLQACRSDRRDGGRARRPRAGACAGRGSSRPTSCRRRRRAPPGAPSTCASSSFEAEFMDHVHLENNVLFRRALAG